ncbi:MAG: hypothetical protein ACOZQL_26295 [Myxococcota bacterium]
MSYDREVLQGFVDSIAGDGVTGVKRARVSTCTAPEAPAHNIHAFQRLFGEETRADDGLFAVTTGLGLRPLRNAVTGSLARVELFTHVDSLELHPELGRGQDVLFVLSALGRMLHGTSAPDGAPWFFGQTLSFPRGAGVAGWDSVLFARHARPVKTSEGEVAFVRVVPLTAAERAGMSQQSEFLDGSALVAQLDAASRAALLARWRTPIV